MLRITRPLAARKRLSLTPLIDVIFILVMFFLLSSTFGVWRPLEIGLGGDGTQRIASGTGAAKVPSVLMTVRPGHTGAAVILEINGVATPEHMMVVELDRLAGVGATDVLFIPAQDMDFQNIVRLLDLARGSRISRVSLNVD